MVKIDLKDRRILSELDKNARIPLTTLAKKVGLSRQVVEYRIKRMEKEKIIFGSIAIIDSVVVGYNWYRVAFRFLNINKEEKNSFINYLKQHKHIFWLGEIGGNWDLIMNFICKDIFKFNKIFEEIIEKYGNFIRDYEILIYINVYDLTRGYFLNEGKKERKIFFHEMKFNPKITLDELDKNIIRELSKNAKITNIDLGKKFIVTANTIKNRIKEMIKNKVILGFRTLINPSVYGISVHMLFFEITRLNLQKERELISYLKTIPNISFLVKHIGRWRIGMEIETKDEKEFQDIFIDIRGKYSDIITDFEIFPIFKDHVMNYFPEGNLI